MFFKGPMTDAVDAYEGGYACGLKGPNTTNCNFSFFSCPEKIEAWEKGKRDGEKKKYENEHGT